MKQLSLATLLLLATLAGCKRDDDDSPAITPANPTCRISTIALSEGSDTSRINLTYDATGRLATSVQDGDAVSFTYSGNTIYANNSGNIDTITVNAAGLITEQKTYQNQGGGGFYQSRTVHTYSGNEVQQSVSIFSYSSGGSTVFSDTNTTTYVWSGGNRISETSDGFTTTYQFTDRLVPAAGGDLFSVGEYIYTGAYIVKNKNLAKSASYGSSEDIAMTYQFDAAGKVTSANYLQNGITGTLRYTYLCR